MRIGFVSTVFSGWGGSEELWGQTALRLAKQGHLIFASVPVSSQLPAPLARLQEAGAMLSQRVFRRPQRVFEPRQYKWLQKWRPDLVVISLAAHHHGARWMEQCQKLKIPYVIVVQSGDESKFPADDEADRLARGYESARQCYFVSVNNIEFVRRSFATPLPNARLIRNPFAVSYDAKLPWPKADKEFRMACVGRLEPQSKGQDILFDVLAAAKWKERPVQISLYGRGLGERTLRRLKEMLGLANVKFAGFCSSVEDIWREHHALILPSRFEGLPLAVVEAMLCARPCIVTNVSGNAELIENNVTGFVAPAANAMFLDDAMERAWAKRSEWQQIGQLARERVRIQVPPDPVEAFVKELVMNL